VPSGWMGDVGDIKMNDQATNNPYSGTTCVEFTYTAKNHRGRDGPVFSGRIRLTIGDQKRRI